jgi:hypothetical protein
MLQVDVITLLRASSQLRSLSEIWHFGSACLAEILDRLVGERLESMQVQTRQAVRLSVRRHQGDSEGGQVPLRSQGVNVEGSSRIWSASIASASKSPSVSV